SPRARGRCSTSRQTAFTGRRTRACRGIGCPSKVSISRIEAAIIRGAFNSPTERFTSSAIKAVTTPTVKPIRQLLWTHSDLQGSSAEKSSLATQTLANWNQIFGWLQEVNLLREAGPRTAPVPFARAAQPADFVARQQSFAVLESV